MNPNIPYGQGQMPIPPHQQQRRHDVPYGRPHINHHTSYGPYYQPMAPMMPYQHYQQQWYPQQYQYPQPYHGQRPQYFHPQMAQQQQMLQQQHHHQGPLVVSSHNHNQIPSTARHYPAAPQNPAPVQRRPSLAPSTSQIQTQTPPSRPTSQVSSGQEKKEEAEVAVQASSTQESSSRASNEEYLEPFVAPIPWLSVPEAQFPPRAPRRRRRILRSQLLHEPLYFPPESAPVQLHSTTSEKREPLDSIAHHETLISRPAETPTTILSETQSDHMSTQPTTPSSVVTTNAVKAQQTPTQSKATHVAGPVLPIVPAIPSSPTATRKPHRDSIVSTLSRPDTELLVSTDDVGQENVVSAVQTPPPAPKSWAELVKKQAAANAAASIAVPIPVMNDSLAPKTESLGEVLGEINLIDSPSKIAFLKPRGLVNTGNMCYMNSVLQMLVFCIPFYDFLDKVAQKAAHAFKSTTPLIDAMIMFMREYPSIDAAATVEQLRLRLKAEDYEKYGDSLRPDFVYETINKLPRFRDMRRGHQQDAQEFLGFLLEELHEECTLAMQKSGTSVSSGRSTPVGGASNTLENTDTQDGWLEVGHKQKPAVTRASGAINADSPITSIFGGKLRSELKIQGNKLSVTLEPYQPLQLDIGSPQVSNIVDALKGLTKPESMQGDFQSVRGTKTTATKQVFIETLPPVLILHLKRFQYDSSTNRAEKIWKKVGYPLEIEIPKEVFPPTARNRFAAHGELPKYRLIGVIYHHGKNANGGHYTVDIRRQDEREWIRVDDTMIRRVRSEDVAEGGCEEDPKVLAAALEKHKKQAQASNNRYENIEAEIEDDQDSGIAWSQVANGHGRSKSTASAVINGNATPKVDASGPQTPRYKDSIKDNKVAYLLFYQRINT